MIVKEDFLNKLRRSFNLNLYEVKIWTALLSRGVSTAGELSDIGNVPRSRAYDVLESLEKKGFVVMKLGKPIKYIAVEPTEVVERVKKLIHQEAENNVQKLAKKDVKIRIAAPMSKEAENLVKEIKGIADIRHTTDLNARFCIVDSKQVMFMVMHDDLVHPSYDISIWVQTPFFATALENLVNNSWKNYEPITLNSTKK